MVSAHARRPVVEPQEIRSGHALAAAASARTVWVSWQTHSNAEISSALSAAWQECSTQSAPPVNALISL